MAIGLGFDAVNGEHNRRTLSRILAQPIYRDALLIGKFLAGLATLGDQPAVPVAAGDRARRLPARRAAGRRRRSPRSLVFLLFTLAYGGVWLALAMLLSIVFRSPATAALVALGVWLFLTLLWPMLAPAIAQVIAPPGPRATQMLGLPTPATLEWQQALWRGSRPTSCSAKCVLAMLSPSTRSLGPIFLEQLAGRGRSARRCRLRRAC